MTSTADTIPRMFFEQVALLGNKRALLYKESGSFKPITWSELGEMVREIAAGLIEIGVKPGDRIAIMSYNRPEWIVVDLAILAIGAITVPVYHTSSSAQTNYIFKKAGADIAFVARSEKAEMLVSCDADVQKIISLDPVGIDSAGACALDYASVRKLGQEGLHTNRAQELDARISAGRPEDCATIIFTSGTTGNPKGVMLSHANILANASACLAAQPVDKEDIYLSFLPLSHSFERTIGQFFMLLAGATIAYAGSIRTVAADMKEVHPTVMLGVPRFYEKLYTRVVDAVEDAPALRKKLFYWAMHIGRKAREIGADGGGVGIILRLQLKLAEKLVFAKLKKRLGGRLHFFVSGGAPLAQDIVEFFLDAGVQILEGYGLTEYSPVIAVNRFNSIRPGTVGIPVPGCEVKIADDGEVMVKGPSVMLGYYNDEEATMNVMRDGWLLTGDLGEMEGGFLRINDRKKDIIVTSGGKNISPQYIENLLMKDSFISHVVIYGEKRNYLTALVVPDFEHFEHANPVKGLAGLSPRELVDRREMYDFIMNRIAEKSAELAPFETVRKIVILPEPLTEEKGELTPTMKIKRKAVILEHLEQIEALYKEDGQRKKPRARWP